MNRLVNRCGFPAFTFATSICSLDLSSKSWQDMWMLELQCHVQIPVTMQDMKISAWKDLELSANVHYLQSWEQKHSNFTQKVFPNNLTTVLKTHGARSGRSWGGDVIPSAARLQQPRRGEVHQKSSNCLRDNQHVSAVNEDKRTTKLSSEKESMKWQSNTNLSFKLIWLMKCLAVNDVHIFPRFCTSLPWHDISRWET